MYLTTYLVIIVQVGGTVALAVLWPPGAEARQPVQTERYADLLCNLEQETLYIPLGYNMFLVALACVFGFAGRKFPYNFNESWFVCLLVDSKWG